MASIEFIQKRIAGAKAKLEKLEKKLVRIRKAEAGNWEKNNPYGYSHYDLKYTQSEIEATQASLAGYEAQLVAETEKANSRNVQVILEFLERWKAQVRNHYMEGLTQYYNDKAAVRTAYDEAHKFQYGTEEYAEAYAKYEALENQFTIDRYGKFEYKPYTDRRGRKTEHEVKVSEGKYEWLRPYSDERTIEAATAKLEKDLRNEADRKYDFIIERTNEIVGTITDASNLTIGDKEDLNGYIIGTRGRAKVQTIGAGGYNIQCFHFRTLITEMK